MKLPPCLYTSSLLVPFPELISSLTLSHGYCSMVATCRQPLTLGQPLSLTPMFLLTIPKHVCPAQTSPMNSQVPTSSCLLKVST